MKGRKRETLSLLWLNPLVVVAFLFLSVIGGCSGSDSGQPDVSGIKVDLKSVRFDQAMAKIDTNHIGEGLAQLAQQYPDFTDFYLDTLMPFGVYHNFNNSSEAISKRVYSFLTHPDFRGVFDTVQKDFPDVKEQDEQIKKGFQYMKYYFPSYNVPKIYYLVTGLGSWNAFTVGDNIIGVGLDMALGPQYPNYSRVQIPDYMIRNLTKESIPVNVFHSVYTGMHPFVVEDKDLLNLMIQKGKEQYFLSKVVPFSEEKTRFGFTKEQLDWCVANEAGIYNFFSKAELLYETNQQKIVRYVNDGPSATGMAPESPGNVGSWLGYKIVQSYMEHHPKTTMRDLFAMQDAQKLLQEAQYKPH